MLHACIPAQSRQALPLSAQHWQLPGTHVASNRCALTAAREQAVEQMDCLVVLTGCSHSMHVFAFPALAFYRYQGLPITWTASVMHIEQIWAVLQTSVPSWHLQRSVCQSTASFLASEVCQDCGQCSIGQAPTLVSRSLRPDQGSNEKSVEYE